MSHAENYEGKGLRTQPLPRLSTDEPFRHEGAKHSRSVWFARSTWVLNRGWRHFGCRARQEGQSGAEDAALWLSCLGCLATKSHPLRYGSNGDLGKNLNAVDATASIPAMHSITAR